MRVLFRAGTQRTETLSLMSLHMYANIQAFFLASHEFGLGMDLRRSAKITSSLVGVVGGQRGIHMRRLRYSVCSIRGVL